MTPESSILVDFDALGGPVYVGRARGQQVRAQLKLDEADRDNKNVTVRIPNSTFSINSSFFLGLFGPSIRAAKSREAFLARFSFSCDARFWESIDAGIERALFENTILLGS
jgi:hypothetical protein